jgi:L-lactate dehydrogenase complex protein LldE
MHPKTGSRDRPLGHPNRKDMHMAKAANRGRAPASAKTSAKASPRSGKAPRKRKSEGTAPEPQPVMRPRKVAMFVTCLVDLFRPSVGFATAKLLADQDIAIEVPPAQTCCGQPAFNSGDRVTARAIAEQVIVAFEPYDAVVIPSGSCGGMIKKHYPELFEGDPVWARRADALSRKTHELVSFLTDILGVAMVDAAYEGKVTYHDSCSGLRELGIDRQPRKLLATVKGLELVEMRDSDVCCGFGGTFCVKYPDISNAMVGKKAGTIAETGADTLLAGDVGCLMNMAGKLKREGIDVEVRHVAEVLAGMTDQPGIAGDKTPGTDGESAGK